MSIRELNFEEFAAVSGGENPNMPDPDPTVMADCYALKGLDGEFLVIGGAAVAAYDHVSE